LSFGHFDFDPGPLRRPLALVDRIQSFRDQALETKLLRDPDQVLCGAKKFLRDPDIVGRFLVLTDNCKNSDVPVVPS
jgi:hypothetical protein